MPISFPSNPTPGQTHQTGGQTWVYDGIAWAGIVAGATGATGPVGYTANVAVYDEGNLVVTTATGLDFVGPGITANLVNGNVAITVSATGSGGANVAVSADPPTGPVTGALWIDSETGELSAFYGNAWAEIYTASTSSTASAVGAVTLNKSTITSNVNIATGDNAVSVGPLYVAANVVISIASGSRWVIL
jgi:hypothetical protein